MSEHFWPNLRYYFKVKVWRPPLAVVIGILVIVVFPLRWLYNIGITFLKD